MENEIWKDVVGYESFYQISNIGRVKSIRWYYLNSKHKNKKPFQEDKILKLQTDLYGYYRVELNMKGKGKKFRINRLVAIAFIPNPDNKPIVNHKNGIKTDNRVENLEWNNDSENITHAFMTGLFKPISGEKHVRAKLSADEVKEIRRKFKTREYKNQTKVAEKYNVSRECIGLIVRNKNWKNV